MENCLKGIKEGKEKEEKNTQNIEYLSQTLSVKDKKNSMMHSIIETESPIYQKKTSTWHFLTQKIVITTLFLLS